MLGWILGSTVVEEKGTLVHVIALLMIPYNTIEFDEYTKISCACGFIYTSMRENMRGQHYIDLNEASPFSPILVIYFLAI